MALNYTTAVIDARLGDVVTAIDAGASNGYLTIATTGMAVVVSTITLDKPCGTIASGVLTFSGLPKVDPLTSGTGTASSATISDSDGNVVASGLTVGNSTAYDIVMSTNLVSSGQSLALTYATITGR